MLTGSSLSLKILYAVYNNSLCTTDLHIAVLETVAWYSQQLLVYFKNLISCIQMQSINLVYKVLHIKLTCSFRGICMHICFICEALSIWTWKQWQLLPKTDSRCRYSSLLLSKDFVFYDERSRQVYVRMLSHIMQIMYVCSTVLWKLVLYLLTRYLLH